MTRFYNSEKRDRFTEKDVTTIFEDLAKKIGHRVEQKGDSCFGSDYEAIGVLQLELEEYKAAVQSRLSSESKIEELLDIAWAALIGAMTLKKEIGNEFPRSDRIKPYPTRVPGFTLQE